MNTIMPASKQSAVGIDSNSKYEKYLNVDSHASNTFIRVLKVAPGII